MFKINFFWGVGYKALSTLVSSARRANTVPITRSNTQGRKGSGGHKRKRVGDNNKTVRLSGNTAPEERENLNSVDRA